MIRYKMFEREITAGEHRSYHVCVNNFGNNFSSKSKFYPIDESLSKINEDFTDYECNITLANHTSPNDYFHISYLAKNLYPPYIQKNILDAFNIKVDFPVIYFTRQYPYVDNFKVGFDHNTYQKFNSKFYKQVMDIIVKLNNVLNGINAIILAGDFDKDGNFIDETINIEIIPYQNKENYFNIKDILLNDFSVVPDKIGRYDKMFDNYVINNFCWHTKIKLFSDREPLVKFYRTYPHNPFIGYHNYK